MENLDKLYLAGGFGNYMAPGSAAKIGMIPKELVPHIVLLGNASLKGARMALTLCDAEEKLRKIRDACRYIELSGDADFNEEYVEQMFFYEEDDE